MAIRTPPSKLPMLVSQALCDELGRIYPYRPLDPKTTTHAEYAAQAAEQRVIERLRQALADQEKADPMTNPILARR